MGFLQRDPGFRVAEAFSSLPVGWLPVQRRSRTRSPSPAGNGRFRIRNGASILNLLKLRFHHRCKAGDDPLH